jgi:dTMP kinase
MTGRFITFEGGEGTGKSTQVKLLADRLAKSQSSHIVTREPGGTPQGEALRELLVTGHTGNWSAASEALLNYAARGEHLRAVIAPALLRGDTVVCDRFMDSTLAYQGYAGGCDLVLIEQLEHAVVGRYRPDLTLVFDIDPEQGLARANARGAPSEDRFERKGLAYHARIRDAFRDIAKSDPTRCKVIDAGRSIDAISSEIWSIVRPFIHGQ